ncbi:hypothetical protein [Ornithinibacillus bavariensis]|uniref:hypothetical protein n=1 Tax=Ornithinibacillus bavariensis TaxID=545502 RepID=UPI000EEF4542|nr:hypothetical protein [Ornithinibacillus sp.]
MRPYDEMNQGLKGLNNRIKLSNHEQQEILTKINRKMEEPFPQKTAFQWKHYIATAVVLGLIIIIALPLLNYSNLNLAGNNQTEPAPEVTGDAPIANEEEDEITIRIENQTGFNISHIYLKIYQDGRMVRSQGAANADSSEIKRGDTFNFSFYDSELGEGLFEVELELSNGSTTTYSTSRVLLNVTEQRGYSLQIRGDSIMNSYLVNPTFKESNDQIKHMEEFKKKLNILLSENEVKTLFGSEFITGKSTNDGTKFWRYDFGTIGGYAYDDQGFQNGADIHGMENGIIQAQLFVEWNENKKVESYTLLYLDKKGEEIHYYHVKPDGSTNGGLVCSFEEEYGWNCPN